MLSLPLHCIEIEALVVSKPGQIKPKFQQWVNMFLSVIKVNQPFQTNRYIKCEENKIFTDGLVLTWVSCGVDLWGGAAAAGALSLLPSGGAGLPLHPLAGRLAALLAVARSGFTAHCWHKAAKHTEVKHQPSGFVFFFLKIVASHAPNVKNGNRPWEGTDEGQSQREEDLVSDLPAFN